MSVTIFEQNDISHYSTPNHEPELAMVRYKNENKYFISDEEFSRERRSFYISAVLALHNNNDVQIATKRILKRRKKDVVIKATVNSKPQVCL